MFSALALEAGISRAAAQCAMCQASSASGIDGGASYNTSTLFMLSAPYLLLLAGAGYVAYSFRRARTRAEEGRQFSDPGLEPGSDPMPVASASQVADSDRLVP